MNFERTNENWKRFKSDQKFNSNFRSPIYPRYEIAKKRFVKVSELELRPPEWLIEGLIEKSCLIGLVGASGCGKSFFAIDMACSIASGHRFHQRPISKGKVLYIAGEGHRGIMARVHAWCDVNSVELSALDLHISSQSIAMHNDMEVLNIVTEAEKLEDVELIIIDTLARSFGGHNENSTQDMNHFINNCDELKGENRSVMVVHHTGHHSERARGNSAFYAALDTELFLSKTGKEICVKCTKMKDTTPFDQLKFSFVPIELTVGEQKFKTCHLEEIKQSQDQNRLTKNEKLALNALISGTKQNVPQDFLNLQQWRYIFYLGHKGDNEEAKKKAFLRARKALEIKGYVNGKGNFYYVRDKDL